MPRILVATEHGRFVGSFHVAPAVPGQPLDPDQIQTLARLLALHCGAATEQELPRLRCLLAQ